MPSKSINIQISICFDIDTPLILCDLRRTQLDRTEYQEKWVDSPNKVVTVLWPG